MAGRSTLRAGEPWSDQDDHDLKTELAAGRSVAEAADFLCRPADEVRQRMAELELSVRFFTRGGVMKAD
jgi:hypothetical protein